MTWRQVKKPHRGIRRGLFLAASTMACAAVIQIAPAVAPADDHAAPGQQGSESIAQWTRDGELGPLPERTTDRAPLSDQANEAGWTFDPTRSDEFDDATLDAERWQPTHRSWRGRQPARFMADNVEVHEGKLRLWMRKNGVPEDQAQRGYHTYTSAAVHAKELSHYGYYEVRAKPMDSAGSSSFWFAATDGRWRTEIDVFELGGKALGHEHRVNMNLHVFHTPDNDQHRNCGDPWHAPFRLADDFHVYGLAWTPERITYYVDGVEVRWVENTEWHQPLYLIFDSETMIDWLGVPKDEDLPSVFEVDYVCVWTQPQSVSANMQSSK